MDADADRYRQEAMLLVRLAECISFRPDKEELLMQAQALRERAEEVEAGSNGGEKRRASA